MDRNAPFRRILAANHEYFKNTVQFKGGYYLSQDDLTRIGIECLDLDLEATGASPGVYLSPFPKSKLHAILEVKRPFDTPYGLITPCEGNLYDALGVSNLIDACMTVSADGDLGLETDWLLRGMDLANGELLMMHTRLHNWRVNLIFDKDDGATPHTTVVLCDAAPLKAEKLSHAEMACIYVMTASRLRSHAYRCHRIIPVTVISICSLFTRIIHGYVDIVEGKVKVFKSPILDLDKDDYSPEMETLLSWCIGQPIGSTKWEPNSEATAKSAL